MARKRRQSNLRRESSLRNCVVCRAAERRRDRDRDRDLGDGPVRTANFPERGGDRARARTARTSVLRESLLNNDLVYILTTRPDHFTVPLLGSYLRRHHPLASFDGDG